MPLLWLWSYFLVLYLFFPALPAAIKNLWLPEDVWSQPLLYQAVWKKISVLPTITPVAHRSVINCR